MNHFGFNRDKLRRGRLGLNAKVLREIRNLAAQTGELPGGEDVERLAAGAELICACGEELRKIWLGKLPAVNGEARMLVLARELVSGGEWSPDAAELLEKIELLDEKYGFEMAELMHLPTALRIALCEAWADVGKEVIRQGRMRLRAERWIERRRIPREDAELFWAHGLALAAEREDADLRGWLDVQLKRRNRDGEWLLERAGRMVGRNCLRLDNLLALKRMMEGLDWQECFEQLSGAECELREDCVYGNMDDESRAAVREAVGEMARAFSMGETALVRRALELAEAEGRTVCFYLYEDEGRERLRRRLGMRRSLRRMVPDGSGRRTVVGVCLLVSALMLGFLWAVEEAVLWIYALPLAWGAGMAVIGCLYPKLVKPRRLLKMKMERVEESARTLVVLPVLLSSEARVRETLAHMEALGCLERDENIDYLLLGDFRDSENPDEADDGAILALARKGIEAINVRSERRKYYYLHRMRVYRSRDARWMGENRKRGALTALNRLLLGLEDGGFEAENSTAKDLAGKYRYVVTLDADTEYLPGTLEKLIGCMEHPLNRKYAVLQPRMGLMASACRNDFVKTMYSAGGVDGYPVSVSDFYQDVCGQGCFAGKGIYEIEKFYRAAEGRLPEENILSHDLIEGILSGAGFLNDVCFYDGCPENLSADLKRSHRWIRGDWQLLPLLFGGGISGLDRMKMAGNLLRSLEKPALLGLLIHSL